MVNWLREMWLSRARARTENPTTDPPAAPTAPIAADPALAEKFAKQAYDLDSLRKAVEDAASVGETIWLSYVFFLLYIAIAAGGVTHRDLLLENPVKLPLFGVELPLVAFFLLAPVLFIVSHAYTLLHFVMLAAKVGKFEIELKKQLPDALETWEGLRRQLPSNIFVQFLAGPREIRKGGVGILLKTIAWISLVFGPVLLLLLIQVQFLPYHLEWATWVQRVAVGVDVILLWLLWPAVVNARSKLTWLLERRGEGWPAARDLAVRYVLGLALCLVPIGFAFTVATFPQEWMDEHAGNRQWIPPNRLTALLGARDPPTPEDPEGKSISTSFHNLMFNGKVDNVTRRRKSLFSNTLVLAGFDALEAMKIDDPKKLASVKQSLNLRGRHLEGAIFYFADLRKADLRTAYLQGTSFYGAKLQGTWFWSAQLQGADLSLAQLPGASLDSAHLQGASLERVELQGALVSNAELQGASLKKAQLQGADLSQAKLQGASLKGAKLQGANFGGSLLADADMSDADVWYMNLKDATLDRVWKDNLNPKAFSKDEFAGLKDYMKKVVPEGEQYDPALDLIEKLNPDKLGQESVGDESRPKPAFDDTHEKDKDKYQHALADSLKTLVCSGDKSAFYIIRRLIDTCRIADTGPNDAPRLIHDILAHGCPVSAALTEHDKADLQEQDNTHLRPQKCAP
jgi:uncharacterized protein YjbI with pentapeptide repeats